MIKNLEVKNFKSIKDLKLDCKKVNIFIGEPNTGKSNILESLGIFSFSYGGSLRDFVRFENMADLFYDHDLGEKIEIIADDDIYCEIKFENGVYRGSGGDKEKKAFPFYFDFNYAGSGSQGGARFSPFKFYKFEVMNVFPKYDSNFLLPPKGTNLLFALQTNRALRKVVTGIFSEYGFRIIFKPEESKIEILKDVIEDVIISHSYSLVSDTLQRVVFYLTAIETNKNSILIFEEPEAHTFPYYTKFLAERVALDKTNQYFISTHNPYFLLSVLEKTPKDDIRIFITYFEDYQTKVRPLTEEEMTKILDLDMSVFFNLDRLLEPE